MHYNLSVILLQLLRQDLPVGRVPPHLRLLELRRILHGNYHQKLRVLDAPDVPLVFLLSDYKIAFMPFVRLHAHQ